jgi:hypothetical protein
MRTLDAAISQLKEDDPHTALTKHALRRMVLTGQVPFVKTGVKILVNYDGLLQTLAGDSNNAASRPVISRIG